MITCCYNCKKNKKYTEVPASPAEHFTAHDGVILCGPCSEGVEECSPATKQWLLDNENK